MKTFRQITIAMFVAIAFAFVPMAGSLEATPQNASCDSNTTFVQGSPVAIGDACGCSGTCNGHCGKARPGLLRRGRLAQRRCQVRCPDCDTQYPEEYCQVSVKEVEVEKTCFEVDFKTICIPKVVPPWKKKRCGGNCGGGCGQAGGCDSHVTGFSGAACDRNCGGGCDSNCGSGCDGNCGSGCGGNCGRKCNPCKGKYCDPNATGICCPSSQCAEARSVKVLKRKKYKCPGCKCKWEVLKPELQSAPTVHSATPSVQTPKSNYRQPPQPIAQPVSPAIGDQYYSPSTQQSPKSNDYFRSSQNRKTQVPLVARRPVTATLSSQPSAAQQRIGSANNQRGQGRTYTLKQTDRE